MMYLMEDRSVKTKEKVPKADTSILTQKQKNQLFGENLCQKRAIQVEIRVQIL